MSGNSHVPHTPPSLQMKGSALQSPEGPERPHPKPVPPNQNFGLFLPPCLTTRFGNSPTRDTSSTPSGRACLETHLGLQETCCEPVLLTDAAGTCPQMLE